MFSTPIGSLKIMLNIQYKSNTNRFQRSRNNLLIIKMVNTQIVTDSNCCKHQQTLKDVSPVRFTVLSSSR